MTVCIAARSHSAVFLVSDRMITAGDVQFEPPMEKIMFLSSAIAVMASGDSVFHHEIMTDVMRDIAQKINEAPADWINVRDVVDLYIHYRNAAKRKRSEAAILAPLGLTLSTFRDHQKSMDSDLVRSISADLINFDMPDVTAIVAGLDNYKGATSTHIYSIDNDYVSCDDVIGFRAIGSGARHAESHFMLARHAWNAQAHDAVMLAYRAKKDSEVAPGVGAETDMFIIGPALGQSNRIRPEIMQRLDKEYRAMKKKQAKMQQEAASEIQRYVDRLPPAIPTTQADKLSPEDSPGAPEPVASTTGSPEKPT